MRLGSRAANPPVEVNGTPPMPGLEKKRPPERAPQRGEEADTREDQAKCRIVNELSTEEAMREAM